MLIYLIRHAEKERLRIDPPLTYLGQKQSQKTAEYFKDIPIDKIYSSPLKRTIQTSEIISKYLKRDFEINDLLRERFNWGDIKDQTHSEFLEMWKKSSLARNWQPPKGSSSNGAGERLKKFFESIDKNNISKVIVVSHGGIIADFLRSTFEDKILNEILPNFSDYYENLIPFSSITILEKINIDYKVISIAYTKHLN
jgi:broad specificity phosphatase PhoE